MSTRARMEIKALNRISKVNVTYARSKEIRNMNAYPRTSPHKC